MRNILLACDTGASSGFVAKNTRQAAKACNIGTGIKARSDSVVGDYTEDIDLLLVGPHLSYMLQDLEDTTELRGVAIQTIPKNAYGELDEDAVPGFALPFLEDQCIKSFRL